MTHYVGRDRVRGGSGSERKVIKWRAGVGVPHSGQKLTELRCT